MATTIAHWGLGFIKRHTYLVLVIICSVIAVLPIYWALSLSIRNPLETFTVAGLAIPFLQFEPTLANWAEELGVGEARSALWSSTIIALGTGVGVIALGTPAAFALARFRFWRPSNESLVLWFLSQRVLPPIVTVFPFFVLFQSLGLLDTHLALIIVNITFNLPLVVVIMRQGFIEVPQDILDAAMVDGASHWDVFSKISLRLTLPSMVAAMLIAIAFTWNEFLFALTIGSRDAVTVPVHMAGAAGTRGIQFWFVGVRVMMAMGPPLVLALFAQRFIVRGMTVGAVRG